MNHMKEFAQLLGLEIGEEFKIEGHSDNSIYKLTEENIEYLSCGHWFSLSSAITKLINGEYKVVKIPKPVLDDEEKKYLSRVIRPWKNEVKYIRKISDANVEYILIIYGNHGTSIMPFPDFKKGTMYKGMESGKHYSLEELGL